MDSSVSVHAGTIAKTLLLLSYFSEVAGGQGPCNSSDWWGGGTSLGNDTDCAGQLENIERAGRGYLIGGAVSVLGCLVMLVSYRKAEPKQKLPPADLLRNKTWCDLGNGLAYVIPAFVTEYWTTDMCKVQAVMIQLFSTASLVWWVSFSVELLWSVQNPFTDHRAHLIYYHTAVLLLSLSSSILLLNSDQIGLTDFDFCWVASSTPNLALPFAIFYAPVILGYLFSLSVLVWVSTTAKVAIPASHKIRTVAITQGQWYIGLIGLFWTFTGVVWFGGFGAGNQDSLPLIILMSISIASKGIVALAVWLKTSQLALKGYSSTPLVTSLRINSLRSPLKSPMIPSENGSGFEMNGVTAEDASMELPDVDECKESIPLKWALRRDVMVACQQGISTMVEMMLEEMRSTGFSGVSEADFTQEVVRQVDRADSDQVRFTFYDFAPKVFHSIRCDIGMQPETYHSIFSFTDFDDRMMEKFSDGGSSGSFFYFTPGKEFIVKTITEREAKLLKSFLRDYYLHLTRNPNTLIVRFYGLYAIKMHRGAKVTHFVVMDNVFLTKRHVHEVYDLKGSWIDRGPVRKERHQGDTDSTVSPKTRAFFSMLGYEKKQGRKSSARVMKDMDIVGVKRLVLDKDLGRALLKQVEADSQFFIRHNIMDYSLLLGIHKGSFDELRVPNEDLALDLTAPHDSLQSPLSSRKTRSSTYIPPAPLTNPAALQPKPTPPLHRRNEGGLYSAFTSEQTHNGDNMYFMGIIDILQTWTFQKRAERFLKSLFLKKDPAGMSAIEPYRYAKRFIERCDDLFMGREKECTIVAIE
eukprot:TRINITY_DN19110_c0_g1_i1.p1 TRINITY_DN19110_c0_g1~~TRINITY_DN19110_c0_g1_i1.p1  ORF type:complete len:807 (+),score=133.55 TRINITY_DN19110_c0_g1_i1:166-2586(+)